MKLYSPGRARRAIFHTIGFRAVSQTTSVLGYIVLVRALTEQSLGVFSLLYSIIPVVGTVASLGLDQILKRFQPEYLQAGNQQGSAWLVRVVTLARLFSSASLVILLLLAWNILAPIFQLGSHQADFALFSVVVLLYFQVALLQFSLASHMLHQYSVGSVALLSAVKLLAYVVLWQAGEFTLRAAILADAGSYAVVYCFLFVVHRRLCMPRVTTARYVPSAIEKSRLKRFAISSNFSDAGSLLLYVQTDNFFISAMMNNVAVGAYAFYARLNEMASNLIPIRQFENVVQPLLFAVPPAEAQVKLPKYFTLLVNVSLLIQFPLIAYAVAYHREIIDIVFDGKFAGYSPLLPLVIALATTGNVIAPPVTMIAQYLEKASLILKSQLFGLYQIAAMFALIPLAGLYGAAIATGTLHLFRNLYVWWHVRSHARWLNWMPALLTAAVIWGSAIGACLLLKLLRLPLPVNMLCGAAICLVAGLIHMRSAAISQSDREVLGGVLHGREATLLQRLGLLPREI